MKKFRAIVLFKYVLLVSSAFLLFVYLPSNEASWEGWVTSVLLVLGTLCTALFLWVISDLCIDIRSIWNYLQATETESTQGLVSTLLSGAKPEPRKKEKKSGSIPFPTASVKQMGDRIFKADARKTCISCTHFAEREKICRLDGVSLEAITVSAVGCQHWSPGLKLAGAIELPRREGQPKDTPDSDA